MVRITNRFMISSKKFVQGRFGAIRWKAFVDELQPETARCFEGKMNPKEDVDFDRVADVLETVERMFKEDREDILFLLGLHNSEDDLSVTQKLLMKLLSVERILKIAALLWKQRVKNGGEILIERKSRGHVLATVRNFGQPIPQWWDYLTGWFTTAISFAGGKNVKVDWVRGGETRANPAEFSAMWD